MCVRTHAHAHTYTCQPVCVCLCACVCWRERERGVWGEEGGGSLSSYLHVCMHSLQPVEKKYNKKDKNGKTSTKSIAFICHYNIY